jgi:pimeloyl-ACP methyl ester carboxylesterase
MGKYWKIAGAVLAVLVLVLVIAFVALRRGDIPYAKLEAKYGSAQSHYVDLPGGFHVHYRDQGNPKGPALVLVHGFFVSLDTWEPWVKRLGGDYRVVTLDLPGHGLTRAPAGYHPTLAGYVKLLDDFANAEHLDHFVLGGSSMGGDVSWRYAIAHPEKLNGLILVDSAGWPDNRPEAQQGIKQLQFLKSPFGRFLGMNFDQTARIRAGFADTYADQKLVGEELVRKYAELGRAPGHRAAIIDLATGFGSEGFATPDKLAAIKTPTLILEGAKDKLIPPSAAAQFASGIHGSRLILYPNVGHMPQEEASDASAADVRTFLKSIEPAKKAPNKSIKSAAQEKNPNTTIFY